jgi:hypothetical protein
MPRRPHRTSDTPATAGLVEHVVRIEPATGFEYRFFSPAGDARIIHLERGAVEFGQPTEVGAFRAGVSPIEKPTRGGFFTSPDYIDIKAEAIIWIEGGASGDSIVCMSYGSYFDVEVTLSLFRTNPVQDPVVVPSRLLSWIAIMEHWPGSVAENCSM